MEFIHDIPLKKDLKPEKNNCLIYQRTLILNYKVQPTGCLENILVNKFDK